MLTRLVEAGDELAVLLDKSMLDSLGIDENSDLEMTVSKGAIVVRPIIKRDGAKISNTSSSRSPAK